MNHKEWSPTNVQQSQIYVLRNESLQNPPERILITIIDCFEKLPIYIFMGFESQDLTIYCHDKSKNFDRELRSVWPGLSMWPKFWPKWIVCYFIKFWFRTFIFNADLASDCDKDQIKELLCLDYGILWIVKRFVSSSIIETNSRFFSRSIPNSESV